MSAQFYDSDWHFPIRCHGTFSVKNDTVALGRYLRNSTAQTLLPAMFVHLPCTTDVPPAEKKLCPTVRPLSQLTQLITEVAHRMVAPNM